MSVPTEKERLRFYLGSILGDPGRAFDIKRGEYDPAHLHTLEDLQSDKGPRPCPRNYSRAAYDEPLATLIKNCGYVDRRFLYAGNDRVSPDRGPVLVKNRRGSTEPVILRCLNSERHWGRRVQQDIPFAAKSDRAFWRGVSSGWDYRPGSRMRLVRTWANKRTDIDVKFSQLRQEYALPGVRERWLPFVDREASMSEFLKHRYLISAEGNDKDSGLNWKLQANSVVLMPEPIAHSWLMEPFLIPYVHYVPLHEDFSDLSEKIDWCRANPHSCQAIIHNAQAFMRQFDNAAHEEALERRVIHEYFARTRGKSRRGKFSPTTQPRWYTVRTSGTLVKKPADTPARPGMGMRIRHPSRRSA